MIDIYEFSSSLPPPSLEVDQYSLRNTLKKSQIIFLLLVFGKTEARNSKYSPAMRSDRLGGLGEEERFGGGGEKIK